MWVKKVFFCKVVIVLIRNYFMMVQAKKFLPFVILIHLISKDSKFGIEIVQSVFLASLCFCYKIQKWTLNKVEKL